MVFLRSLPLFLSLLMLAICPVSADQVESESESVIENFCELDDGIYEADLPSERKLRLVIESRQIVSMYFISNNWAPVWASVHDYFFGSEYKVMYFKRLLAGCQGDRWFFAWGQPQESDDKQLTEVSVEGYQQISKWQYFDGGGGLVEGSYSQTDPDSQKEASLTLAQVEGLSAFSIWTSRVVHRRNMMLCFPIMV